MFCDDAFYLIYVVFINTSAMFDVTPQMRFPSMFDHFLMYRRSAYRACSASRYKAICIYVEIKIAPACAALCAIFKIKNDPYGADPDGAYSNQNPPFR